MYSAVLEILQPKKSNKSVLPEKNILLNMAQSRDNDLDICKESFQKTIESIFEPMDLDRLRKFGRYIV